MAPSYEAPGATPPACLAVGERAVFYQHLVEVFPIPRRFTVEYRFAYMKEQLAAQAHPSSEQQAS